MANKYDLFNNYAEKELSSKLGAAWEFFQVMPNDEFPKLHDLLPNGTITQDKLPMKLRTYCFACCYKLYIFLYKKHLSKTVIFFFICAIIGFLRSPIEGCVISTGVIIFFLMRKGQNVRDLIQLGIKNFNATNFEGALANFKEVQTLLPKYADYFNDWIAYCLLYLERPKEALEFIQTHKVTAKRAKIFFLFLILNEPQEAVDYFKNSFNRNEIDKWPSILVIPALVYSNIIKNPIKTIDFLESYDVLNWTLNNDTYNVYELLAKQYTASNNKEKLKNLYIKMNKFKPDDIVVAERLKKLLQEE